MGTWVKVARQNQDSAVGARGCGIPVDSVIRGCPVPPGPPGVTVEVLLEFAGKIWRRAREGVSGGPCVRAWAENG